MVEIQSLAESIYERLKSGDRNVEERQLDIKKEWYHVQSSKGRQAIREEFCKDVCALANSCYPSLGYLLFGLSTEAPFVFEAPLPMDEASLQQQIASGISPIPEVHFCNLQVTGLSISAATISHSVKSLPYVARYQNNLWIPWVRLGSSTRSASHLDLVSMFDMRRGAEQQALPRLKLLGPLQWATNWHDPGRRWSPVEGAPKNQVSGLRTTLQIANPGTLSTAFTLLSAKLEWTDGEPAVSDSCCPDSGWPIAVTERTASDCPVTFHFERLNTDRLVSVGRLTIVGTDLDDRLHAFEFHAPRIEVL